MKPEMAEAVDASSEPDMSHSLDAPNASAAMDRRNGPDRRTRTLYSLVYGSFNPRRRGPRRTDARSLRDLDWHQPQWLAVAILIIALSCVDAALPLILPARGA